MWFYMSIIKMLSSGKNRAKQALRLVNKTNCCKSNIKLIMNALNANINYANMENRERFGVWYTNYYRTSLLVVFDYLFLLHLAHIGKGISE